MIEIVHVSKSFGDIKAIDDVSLEIKDGSVFGMIGTNGAGKSTLMRMISGIYKEDEGAIKVDGEFVFENSEAKKNIFDQYLDDDITAQEEKKLGKKKENNQQEEDNKENNQQEEDNKENNQPN